MTDTAPDPELAEVADTLEGYEAQAKRRQEQALEEMTAPLDKAVLAVAVSAPFLVLIFERMCV